MLLLYEGSIKHLRRNYSQEMKINGQPLMAGNFTIKQLIVEIHVAIAI